MQIKELKWDFDAWEDYLYWQSQDKKNPKKNQPAHKRYAERPL